MTAKGQPTRACHVRNKKKFEITYISIASHMVEPVSVQTLNWRTQNYVPAIIYCDECKTHPTLLAVMVTILNHDQLICLCSMLYRMLVNNLKTPKTITVFT